jgi:phosphate transport system substrate-binding protein
VILIKEQALMKHWLLGRASATVLSVTVVAGWSLTASAAEVVKIDGSSTVFPISEAVAEEFQTKNPESRVTVGLSGTGGGFKKFCRGETDISDASRPITKLEMGDCAANGIKYFELPIAFDALTVVISPQNTWAKSLTVQQLNTMWSPAAQGSVTKWNQVDPSFPDAPLVLYGPGADSGTFEYFTEAVNGKSKSSRGDYSASEDDNVLVQGVSGDPNALGYFGYAYYIANQDKLTAVTINGVAPSEQTVVDGTYNPLSRPIFIYVKESSYNASATVKAFVDFYLTEGKKFVAEVGYVALPDSAYQAGMDRIAAGKAGTTFGGANKIGVKIADVMSAEPSLTPGEGS